MHQRKPYKCSVCGAEVPDLPMSVLKHQLSHVRRPYAVDRLNAGDEPEPATKDELRSRPADG
ncbi:MAG: hypothetical protein ACOY4R_16255 [Pseudomonadota bacterium]